MFKLHRRLISVFIDFLMVPVAWYGAYWIRFNLGLVPPQELLHATYLLPIILVAQVAIFWFFGLYRGIWHFASLPDLIRILKAVLVGVIISLIIVFFVPFRIPRSIVPIYAWLLVSLLGGARLLYRWLKNYAGGNFKSGKRTLVIGAGQAADLLLREFLKSVSSDIYNLVGLVDDDPKKNGCELHGVRVLGELEKIPEFIVSYDVELVIIAMPSAKASVIRKIVDYCKDAKVEFRTVPRLNDLVSGNVTVSSLREVSVEDLLGRDPVTLDWSGIAEIINDKKIVVSGGGGSIGSELCRQIACLTPALLIIIDNSEFNLYMIDKELREKFPNLHLVVCLADVADLVNMQKIMGQYKPHIVFHAAAYKHVPLLENQARAAVRNNVLGTYNIAQAAVANDVATFVLISSDKAVNPVNIMGATKRAAEIVCQNLNGKSMTHFITVRFGNVLDSAGSVIPLFREQLAAGKDLTVTHPEVTRYFMTIPEATQLILQATILGKNGEIFVLDMGEPIKIADLAKQMVCLSGKAIGEDVSIVYIGLRPGEKLYEELFYNAEELLPTTHIKIKQARYQTSDWYKIVDHMDQFGYMCDICDDENNFVDVLLKMVPESLLAGNKNS